MTWATTEFQKLFLLPSRNGVYKGKEYHGSGAKVINMGELFAYDRVGPQEMSRIQMSEQELLKSGVETGDLLFGRRSLVEAGAGRCALAWGVNEPTTFESSVIRVRLDEAIADPTFYFYYFRSPHGRSLIRSIVNGATVKGIRGSDLQRLQVVRPPVEEQQKVASCLRSFDDLIENNRRRIALLEESARLLYREWFVHLRFPGVETVNITNGTPEGWKAQCLGDIGKQIKEQADPRQLSPDTAYLSMEHMGSKSLTLGLWESAAKVNSSKLRFETDDVLFGRIRPYFHKVGIAQVSGVTSTDVIVVRASSEKLLALVALTMSSNEFVAHAVTTSNGTKMPRADWKVLKEWPVLVPDTDSLTVFAGKVLPMFQMCKTLSAQNRYLQEARDALLPKLMSGEIAV